MDYTLPANDKTGAGFDVYVRPGTTTRATLLLGHEDTNALLMEVLTPLGKHHVLVAHAPRMNIGHEPYLSWWAATWREVPHIIDPASVLVVADTNWAARPADRGTPRSEDAGFRAFVRAFNPRDGNRWTCTPSPPRPTLVSREPLAPALTRSSATGTR